VLAGSKSSHSHQIPRHFIIIDSESRNLSIIVTNKNPIKINYNFSFNFNFNFSFNFKLEFNFIIIAIAAANFSILCRTSDYGTSLTHLVLRFDYYIIVIATIIIIVKIDNFIIIVIVLKNYLRKKILNFGEINCYYYFYYLNEYSTYCLDLYDFRFNFIEHEFNFNYLKLMFDVVFNAFDNFIEA
jgi:hypothetical protein